MGELIAFRTQSQNLPSGVVTFLFSDVQGSTRMLRRAPDLYPDALARHRALVCGALDRWGGHLVSTEGDALFYAFADAGSAAAGAVEAQQALARHSWPEHLEFKVRMGLHTGTAAPVGGDYVSLAVHQAARISACAHGGQVLLSEQARKAIDLPVTDLGRFRLKDFDEPGHLFQLHVQGGPGEFPAPSYLGGGSPRSCRSSHDLRRASRSDSAPVDPTQSVS